MKKTIYLFLFLATTSCSTTKSKDNANKLYQILLTKDHGGSSFQFYETITEQKEFKMMLGDDELKKYIKPNDILTSNFILVNLGEKSLKGYKTEIESIEELFDKIVISIKEIEPKNLNNQEITTPYCIIKINSKKTIEIK